MPTPHTIHTYQYDELSPRAQEQAREWYRQCEAETFGAHGELTDEDSDIAHVARILGITFDTHPVKLLGGGTRHEPDIWWQLHTQGAGANFSGRWERPAGDLLAGIREYAPKDRELAAIVAALDWPIGLSARIKAGRDTHSRSLTVEVYAPNDEDAAESPAWAAAAEAVTTAIRAFCDWIYQSIDAAWDDRMRDEGIEEGIRANEYRFSVDGDRRVTL